MLSSSRTMRQRGLGEERTPYARFYRDLKSCKRFMVTQGLPMVTPDGKRIEPEWEQQGASPSFLAKNNLFFASVNKKAIELKVKETQSDGRMKNDRKA